jgi:hypothetical protein
MLHMRLLLPLHFQLNVFNNMQTHVVGGKSALMDVKIEVVVLLGKDVSLHFL